MTAELAATHFPLTGAVDEDDFRSIWVKVAELPDIGAIAFEKAEDGTAEMIIKHKADTPPDPAALAEAVRSAGDYELTI